MLTLLLFGIGGSIFIIIFTLFILRKPEQK